MIGLCGPAPQPSCPASNNALSLTMPSNGNLAPPGYYMLFLLDSAGVPSVAKIIQLTPFATVAPAGTISSPAANVTVTAGNSVSFSTTTAAAKYSWVFPGGTPAASIAQNPGNVIFATPGTYQVSLTAVDSSGHADPHPPTRTITVLPTTGDFSIEVSPAAVQVAPGGTATFNVTVKSLSGFAGPVTLAVSSESGFPAGITSVGFSPSIINNGAGSSTLTMTTTTATVPYALSITIKGTSGTLSHTAATTLIVALAPPGGLSAAPGDRNISLSWPASIGASSYQLARSLFSGGPYQTLACPASTGFLDSGLVNGTTYFYVVSAAFIGGSNGGGESAKSVQASATPVPPPPGTPTGLSAQASSGRVALTWNAVAGSTSYRVKRATASGGPYNSIANPSNTAYTDTAVTNGTTYYYAVSAVNAGGESTNSAQVSATPVAGTSGGQSLFTAQTPAQPSASDGVAYELGMKFRATQAGTITALRYWKAANDTGMHTGRLWSASGTLLGSVAFTNETASGWQQQSLPTAIQTQANTTYVVSVNVGLRYPFTGAGLATSIANGDLSSVADGNNGVYGNPGSFPRSSFNSSNYFRDVVFVRAAIGAATKLGLSASTGITSKGLPAIFTVRVQDPNGNTLSTASNPITFAVAGVTGAFNPAATVNAANGVAASTFTPSSAGNATVSVSASGLTGASATLFIAAAPQSLFTTQTPVRPAVNDGRPYELGMKFRLSKAGVINGIRFYKSVGDTGTHVGRIWSANGTLLASVPFTGETASGWQQQLLSTPLPVQANITYIVSTNIISTYPFTGSGLATSIVNGNISSVADGGNGVYGNASAFPTNSFQNANYFRDIVFSPGP